VPTRFERDTAVRRRDDTTFDARVDTAWWVMRGPNGGYLAAIILRALIETVDDPARDPRSLTVHYAAPLEEGDVTITTALERVGRSLSSVSARMYQGDRLVAIAMSAFSKPRPGPEFCDFVVPDVAPPSEIKAVPVPDPAPPIAHRWDTRWAIGRPPDPSLPLAREAVAGGWIRLEEPQVLDAPVVAAITDAWIPPVFSRMNEPLVVPTIDLTVHFRTSLPLPTASPDDFLLAVFRTNAAAEGFLEEDGEVWSADGRLVAQSRQLAVAMPFTPPGSQAG
jgi:acyl-CoA thioesterase